MKRKSKTTLSEIGHHLHSRCGTRRDGRLSQLYYVIEFEVHFFEESHADHRVTDEESLDLGIERESSPISLDRDHPTNHIKMDAVVNSQIQEPLDLVKLALGE